jgi:ABC-type transporter Mla subunit MlaD
VSQAIAIIALALSLLTSIVGVTAVIVQMRTNMATLSKQSDRQDDRDDKAAKELSELFALLKSFISAQTEINKSVELGLRSTINKLEEVERRTVQQSAIVELLTEALKRGPRTLAAGEGKLNIEP